MAQLTVQVHMHCGGADTAGKRAILCMSPFLLCRGRHQSEPGRGTVHNMEDKSLLDKKQSRYLTEDRTCSFFLICGCIRLLAAYSAVVFYLYNLPKSDIMVLC